MGFLTGQDLKGKLTDFFLSREEAFTHDRSCISASLQPKCVVQVIFLLTELNSRENKLSSPALKKKRIPLQNDKRNRNFETHYFSDQQKTRLTYISVTLV